MSEAQYSHMTEEERERIRARFLALKSVRELAALIGADYGKHIVYYLYQRNPDSNYKEFTIFKKSGGERKICAPKSKLKILQKNLLRALTAVYEPKACVHGFATGRSINTNGNAHRRPRFVLNVDLENFFPSINFGRVRGLFIAKPYGLPPEVATVLAQICCYKNHLPQGAPTSPIISNMICAKLDSNLRRLATDYQCYYTRYADDITFSTNRRTFPRGLCIVDHSNERKVASVGERLRDTIESNGFIINESKTRLHTRDDRQEVTGLVVNEFTNVRRTYVRNVRAMLHSWAVLGLEGAQRRFLERYDLGNRAPGAEIPSFENHVRGKISFIQSIRGDGNPIYQSLSRTFNSLSPSNPIKLPDPPHLDFLTKSVYVIEGSHEDDFLQGTAFYLDGYGFVTCFHCVGKAPYVFLPSSPHEKIRVKLTKSDAHVDIAVLESIDYWETPAHLSKHQLNGPTFVGQAIAIAGFPAYAPGRSLTWKDGKVSSFYKKSGSDRFQVSFGITAGASGSPIVAENGRVLGVAVTGADFEHEEDLHADHGAIPIGVIDSLK